MRSRKTLPASRRVQGHRSKPSSQGALRAAGGRGGLSIGPRGQCPSFLFSSRGRWSASGQVPLRAPAKLLPGRPSASSRPDWAGSCQQPPTSRSSSRKAPSGETWEPGEESGAHSPACRAAGRGRGLPMRRAVGFSPPRPLPAGGGSRRHWRLSGVQTCASLSRAWFTCSPLELFKNNHVHTNFPWETAQEAPPRGRGGGGSVWADPGRGRQLG